MHHRAAQSHRFIGCGGRMRCGLGWRWRAHHAANGGIRDAGVGEQAFERISAREASRRLAQQAGVQQAVVGCGMALRAGAAGAARASMAEKKNGIASMTHYISFLFSILDIPPCVLPWPH